MISNMLGNILVWFLEIAFAGLIGFLIGYILWNSIKIKMIGGIVAGIIFAVFYVIGLAILIFSALGM